MSAPNIMPISNKRTALDYALAYVNIGWWVLPLAKGTKQPAHWLIKNGVHGASNDPEVVREWFTRGPECGIGIAMLPSGLVGIDIDPRNGGYDTMERLESTNGPLVSDVLALTGGGGEHRIFYASLVTGLPGKLGPGVDVKADGYLCVEPSIHPNGNQYVWEGSSDPLEGCVPSSLPGWVRDLSRTVLTSPETSIAFASRFIDPKQMLEVQEALPFIDCEDYHEWINIGQCLKGAGSAGFGLWDNWSRASDKYDPQEMGKKWRSFAPKSLNLETIFFKAQQNGWVNPLSKLASDREATLKALADDLQSVKVYEPVAQKTGCLIPFPVPLLDEVGQFICRTQGIENCVSVQMACMSIAGIAASRLYQSEHGDGAHLYQLLCAQSVGDLLPLHKAVGQILRDAGIRKMMREQRFTSPSTFYKTLMRAPATLWLAAEWGTMTAFAKRQSSGLVDHVMNLLVNAYVQNDICLDNPDELGFKAGSGINDDMPTIRRPSLSMLAFTSQSMLPTSFAVGEIGRGAVEQLIFHSANIEFVGQMQAEDTPVWMIEHIRNIRNLPGLNQDLDLTSIFNGNAEFLPGQTTVVFSAKPDEHYPAFDALCECNRSARPLARGARTQLRRMAVALAVWGNPKAPVVSREILDWCAAFVLDRLTEALSALNLIGGSEDGKASLYQTVLQSISQEGAAGSTPSMVVRSNYKFRSLPSVKREELITQLIEDGEVIEQKNSNGKGVRLFAAGFVRQVKN